MTLDPQPFSLDALLGSLSVLLSASRQHKPVEIVFDLPQPLPDCLLGDSMRLQQVLTNLGSNALKFTEQGEILVRVEALAQTASHVTLRFSVTDTGIGISRDLHDKLFHSFSQAESSTTRRFGGTGLGLAISQRIVQMMGGEIELQSQPGKGSTFSFRLELPVVNETAPPTLAGLTVWLSESHPATRQALLGLCHGLGWQSHVFADAASLHAALQAHTGSTPPCQLALLDSLPADDSRQACKLLRARFPALPVILLTAEPQARRQTDDPATAWLVKPLTAGMLQDAANLVLQPPTAANNASPGTATGTDSAPALSGLRLLLVEDNATNRMIAQGLLGKDGAQIDIAENGAEAVAAVARATAPYDAVLMDLQMPVMDGMAATREIRHTLGQTRLPIIAMTANALASDRAQCLAAGMSDHIGKPFVLAELRQLLLKHIAANRAASNTPR